MVFGAAFAGRPTDLRGAESIVGPFVNNLPVRMTVNRDSTTDEFLRNLHRLLLELNSHQFMPLMEIQRYSEMPWRYRLFESVVVFQNYLVDESARRFGRQIAIADFTGPIHTNYPVMLLAEPGATLRLTLIYEQQTVARKTVERWGRDLALLMQRMPDFFDQRVAELQELLSPPVVASAKPRERIRAESQNYVPPQTEMEKTIAGVWQGMFGLEQVGIEENFFDLGGHSLLLVQMHGRLQETLKAEFSIVTLFEHPTVRSLARHLGEPSVSAAKTGQQWRDRAQSQRQALAQLRTQTKGGSKLIEESYEGIAIIGMTGRFPGAESVEEFWANLVAGKESISFFRDAELAESGLDAAALEEPRPLRSGPRHSEGCGLFRRGVLRHSSERSRSDGPAAPPLPRALLDGARACRLRTQPGTRHRRRLCRRDLQHLLSACATPAAGPDRSDRPRTGDVRQ